MGYAAAAMSDFISPIPDGPVIRDTPPAPLEGARVGAWRGRLGAGVAAFGSSISASAANRLETGGPEISHDDAAARMNAGGYDSGVLPEGAISQGYLDAIIEQQGAVARMNFEAERAHLGGFSRGAAGLIGGALDPLFLALGPIFGRTTALARGGLAARVAYGGAEGAAVMSAYEIGLKEFGTAAGDRDIDFYQASSSALWGMLLGGAAHGAFGKPLTTETIAALERTAAAAAKMGIPENEVVSPAGAVGTHQIMPATARGLGIDPVTLTDPTVNKLAASRLLDELNGQYPGDPEAAAIAYNAGPKWADRWIAAGRDDAILPKETQGYVARLREMTEVPGAIRVRKPPTMPGEVPAMSPELNARIANVAAGQFARDADISVEWVVSQSRLSGRLGFMETLDYAAERERFVKPNSALTNDPAVIEQQAKVAAVVEQAPVPVNIIRAKDALSPEVEKFVQETEAALTEAKAAADAAGDPVFPGMLDELNASGKAHDEFQIAVKTAVDCALKRGL